MEPFSPWKRMYYIFWVRLCILSFPACNKHAPLCHLRPVRLYSMIPQSNQQNNFRRKKLLIIKMCVMIFCTYFAWNVGPVAQSVLRLSYRAGRSGIESRWGRDFPPVQTGPGAHLPSCKMGAGSFPEVMCGWGVLLTTQPPSSAAVMEE